MRLTLIYALLCMVAACALVAVQSSELDAAASWEQVDSDLAYAEEDGTFLEMDAEMDAEVDEDMEMEDASELDLDAALDLAAAHAADVAATIAPHEMEAAGIGAHPTAFSSFNSISEEETIALIEEARAFLSTTPSTPAPYISPVAKAAAAKALASGQASSKLKLRPASVRGAEEETKQKYKRFVALHPNRARNSITDDYRNFKSNRAKIIALNDKYGTPSNLSPFKSTSPWANLSPAEFKKRYLTTRPHSQRKSKGNGVYKSKNVPAGSAASATNQANKSVKLSGARKTASQVAKKGGKSLLEMGQSDPVKTGGGGRVGGSGGSSQKSGKTGGSGGSTVDKSGKTGGNGGSVDKSGKTGGGGQVSGSGIPYAFTPLTAADIKNSMLSANVNPGNLESVLPWFAQRGSAKPTDPVNDQGECGSCWAQVASQAIYRRQLQGLGNNTPRNFPSVQQILDCVKTDLSGGCAGGTPMDALDWTSKNPMASEYSYPLLGGLKTATCHPSTEKTVPFKSFGWENAVDPCTTPNCENQQRKETILLRSMKMDGKRPIIYVHSANWPMYAGGIFPVSLCSSTLEAGDHVVELWSFGQDAKGVPYWIVRNSWGSKWGENGFIYLPFGVNACGMANFAILPSSGN